MDELNLDISEDSNEKDNITYLSGMYKEWFLDYASRYFRTSCSCTRRWIKACTKKNSSFYERIRRW